MSRRFCFRAQSASDRLRRVGALVSCFEIGLSEDVSRRRLSQFFEWVDSKMDGFVPAGTMPNEKICLTLVMQSQDSRREAAVRGIGSKLVMFDRQLGVSEEKSKRENQLRLA